MTEINTQPLIKLGLTALEAATYAHLLENSPATGYGVAKGIRKPVANVYKAIESLYEKGAIDIEGGKKRLCRAVPFEELLESLDRRFQERREVARIEMSRLKAPRPDDRIYLLRTVDQVLSRFQSMLAQSRDVAMLDLFPFAAEKLRAHIETAAARGVQVVVKVYRPIQIEGADLIIDHQGDSKIHKWPGQWANGVIDCEEHLVAFFSDDGSRVHQAVWSGSPYISWIYYCGFVHELMSSHLDQGFSGRKSRAELESIFRRHIDLISPEAAGSRSLMTNLRQSADRNPEK